MEIDKKEYEAFAKEYKSEDQEILVLFSDKSGGAGKASGNLWSASAYFLAYQNVQTGEVKKGDGRIVWPITDGECKRHGSAYPYFFQKGAIYRLRVCDLSDRTVPEGRLPSFYNRFLVTEVLEENVQNNELAAVLEAYRTPVVLEDKVLGNFTLDKDYSHFEGSMTWGEKQISVYMEVDSDDQGSWTSTLHKLRTLHEQQKDKDSELRRFAAGQLTDLANDWLQDEDSEAITEEIFAQRIWLSELSMDSDGNYTAYYNDDDMFYGHVVTVYGNLESGLQDANMEG